MASDSCSLAQRRHDSTLSHHIVASTWFGFSTSRKRRISDPPAASSDCRNESQASFARSMSENTNTWVL
jgi:hypothetical protein